MDMIKHNAQVSDLIWEKITTHTEEDGEIQDVLRVGK